VNFRKIFDLDIILVILIVLNFMVPRELKFKIADIVLLFFFAVWFFKELIVYKFIFKKNIFNFLIVFILSYILIIALISALFNGISNLYLFTKDLYSFGSLLIVFIIYNRIEITERKINLFVKILFICFFVIALWNILLFEVHPLKVWYIHQWKLLRLSAVGMGYFDTSGPGGPYTNIGSLRIVNYIGGFGSLAWISQIVIPFLMIYLDKAAVSSLKNSKQSIFIVFTIISGYFGAVFLLSRSVVLMLLTSITGLIYSEKNKKQIILLGLVFVLLLLVSSPKMDETYPGKKIISYSNTITNRFGDLKKDVRAGIFKAGVKEILKSPFIGIGMGNYITFPYGDRQGVSDGIDCLYLSYGLKLGIPGLLLFLVFYGYVFYYGLRYLNRNKELSSSPQYKYSKGALISLSAVLMMGIVSYPFNNLSFTVIFWVLFGYFSKIIFANEESNAR